MIPEFQEIGLTFTDQSHEFIDRLMYSENQGIMICLLGSKATQRKRCFIKSIEEPTYREVDLPFEAVNIALNQSTLVATSKVESLINGKQLWCSFEPYCSKDKLSGEVSLAFNSPNTRRIWVAKFIQSDSKRLHCIFARELKLESGGVKVQYSLGDFDVSTGAITLVKDLATPFA